MCFARRVAAIEQIGLKRCVLFCMYVICSDNIGRIRLVSKLTYLSDGDI